MQTDPLFNRFALALTLALAFGLYPAYAATEIDPKQNAWSRPPQHFQDLEGQQRSLDEWRGKVILLNFWATWCGPCQAEIPRLMAYQRDYGERGLVVLGVGLDEPRKLRNYVRSLRINYPILVADPEQAVPLLTQWGDPRGVVPHNVVIGVDGEIALSYRGVVDDEIFEEYVLPLLEHPQTSKMVDSPNPIAPK